MIGDWTDGWMIEHREASNNTPYIDGFILSYVFEHAWIPKDSINVVTSDLKTWTSNSKLTFPIDVFSNRSADSMTLPRFISTDMTIYKFRTGWETENSSYGVGFIVFNKARDEMTVYRQMVR